MKFFRSRARRTKPSPVFRLAELYHAGQYAEAEKEGRALIRSPLSERELVVAWTVVAISVGSQGRPTEAVSAYEEALAVSHDFYGAEHWQTLKLRSDRAQQLAVGAGTPSARRSARPSSVPRPGPRTRTSGSSRSRPPTDSSTPSTSRGST